jgi:hypothetical protein
MKRLCIVLLSAACGVISPAGAGQNVPLAGAHAVGLWDPYTGKLSLKLDEELPVHDLALTLDGTMLASAGDGGLSVWNAPGATIGRSRFMSTNRRDNGRASGRPFRCSSVKVRTL